MEKSNITSWQDLSIEEITSERAKEISAIKERYFKSKLIRPNDDIHELVDVAWQEDRYSKGEVIGYILVNNPKDIKRRDFIFSYSPMGLAISKAKGFRDLPAFPDLNKVYVSKDNEMFPSFLSKLPQKGRRDLREGTESDTELLIKYSRVITDDIIFMPPNYLAKAKELMKLHDNDLKSAESIFVSNLVDTDIKGIDTSIRRRNVAIKPSEKQCPDEYGDK